ncbi:MAG: PqqD family protein [Planctomycetes bacterium]|nr:PqqD family protein [Planctomycetota bacterium]
MGDLDTCYEKTPSLVHREIAGEILLVPIRRNVADLQSIYTLNEVAADVWQLIDGERSVSQMKEELVKKYEADEEELEEDLLGLLQQLKVLGGIQEKGASSSPR